MQTVIYRIKGEPAAIIKNPRVTRRIIDPYVQRRMHYQQQLINQHNERPLLTGAWNLEIHFMFPCKSSHHRSHTDSPSLMCLLRFVDDIAKNIIYTNDCIITEVKMIKEYSHIDPETVLIFNRK